MARAFCAGCNDGALDARAPHDDGSKLATMTTATSASAIPIQTSGRRITIASLHGALLWLLAFAGAFVFIEPSPYEYVGVITIMLFALTGFTLAASVAPMVLLLIFITIGYATSVVQVSDQAKPVTWVFISAFLAATAIFYAGMLGVDTQRRLELLMRGYLTGALIAALVAVAAYFHLFGDVSDMFVLYGRARGTFNDPNVLAAFLVLPGLLVFQRILAGHAVVRSCLMLLLMLAALLLSFSRGAWGQFVLAAAVLMGLTFITSRSANERVRIVLLAALGVA